VVVNVECSTSLRRINGTGGKTCTTLDFTNEMSLPVGTGHSSRSARQPKSQERLTLHPQRRINDGWGWGFKDLG